jgi:hypothetical protein
MADGEETFMAKSTKEPRDGRAAEETQRLYASAYASRLAKQVSDELDSSRRTAMVRKKRDRRG